MFELVQKISKKCRASPNKRTVKQPKISDYWLDQSIKTTNSFQQLDNQEDESIDDNAVARNTTDGNGHSNKIPKQQPIFVQ